MNGVISTGVVPNELKKTELVLISKVGQGKDMLEQSSSTSKLLE